MSEVIITETKTETVTHEVKTVKALKCDVCGKEITAKDDIRIRGIKYWELTTQHNDWGNDSVDSIEYFDLCSENCVRAKLEKYFADCKRSFTQRFELNQETFIQYRKE